MARGLYRDQQGDVMVQYHMHQARIPHDKYVDSGYQPIHDELPTHETYNDAQKAACTALEKEAERLLARAAHKKPRAEKREVTRRGADRRTRADGKDAPTKF
jgi:hypothetical protein